MRHDTSLDERAATPKPPTGVTVSATNSPSEPGSHSDGQVQRGEPAPAAARSAMTRSARTEGALQIAIMLAIGGAAGAASFTHVHNVAASHGQGGWLAWADAIVLELMSIASGLEMRRRKRHHKSVRFPAVVLTCSVALSLGAQVVEAERSIIGWIAAALPAFGFLVMVKIALGHAGPLVRTDSGASVLNAHTVHGEPARGAPITLPRRRVSGSVVSDDTSHVPRSGPNYLLAGTAAPDTRPPPERMATAESPTAPVEPRRAGGPGRATPTSPEPTPLSRPSTSMAGHRRAAHRTTPVKVPATAATLLQWANTWTQMCADGDLVHGPINDDQRARSQYQLSARQLRNIRTAARNGALRHQAMRLDITLPADYDDNPPAPSAHRRTPSPIAA